MHANDLPVPWRDASPLCPPEDIGRIVALVEKTRNSSSDYEDLLLALRHADARAAEETGSPRHIRYAQAVLEIAVEWRMPAVERWAAAWLAASGSRHLRLRWSSRSRDGRFRRDGRARGRILALAGGRARVVVGTQAGTVEEWTAGTGLSILGDLGDAPVRSVAHHGERVFAGGPHGRFWATGWDPPPPPLPQKAALTAAAISPDGAIACGDEDGMVFLWRPGEEWRPIPPPADPPSTVVALDLRGDEVAAVWAAGQVARFSGGAWCLLPPMARGIVAAAWGPGGELALVGRDRKLYGVPPPGTHHGARAVAWSPTGRLASADRAAILIDGERLAGDDGIERIAFLGDGDAEYLVSTAGADLVQWDPRESGSDEPTFAPGDAVTAVAVDPRDRARAAVGTLHGRVVEFDGAGVPRGHPSALPRRGRVEQLVPHGDGWLVAAGTGGACHWRPHAAKPFTDLGPRLCLAVAAHGGRYAIGQGDTVEQNGAILMRFGSTVRDLRFGPDGTLIALDDHGEIKVIDTGGATLWRIPPLGDGFRLLDGDRHGVLVRTPQGTLAEVTPTGVRPSRRRAPAGGSGVVAYGRDLIGALSGRQVLVAERGTATPLAAPFPAKVLALGDRRVVAAGGSRVAGFDIVGASARPSEEIHLRARSDAGGCELRLRDSLIPLSREVIGHLKKVDGDSVRDLSDAVFMSGQIGDLLWRAGLELAIDRARGADPDRRLRLVLDCADEEADDLPWELLHPSNAPFVWFDDPPITVLRRVRDATASPSGSAPARPALLAVRGVHRELGGVDAAHERIRRRTRRHDVRLLHDRPLAIGDFRALRDALNGRADILHVWAHCGRERVEFHPGGAYPVEDIAQRIAPMGPRLVVLVGCRSGALGRALVRRGVPAVVAMRVPVYSGTVQPLVDDFTAAVLARRPLDEAFAEALRRYVLTGQPGAAAIPMLYVAPDTDLTLFT